MSKHNHYANNCTSLTCYDYYVHLEYEGPGSHIMTYEEWAADKQ